MTHNIRQYADEDLAAVLSSWENASKIAHPFLTKEFTDQERLNIPNLYLPNADTWVVETGGTVVGFIAMLGNEVGAIFVEPEFQGKGLGRVLMDKAHELYGDLEVDVFQANSIGCKFYAKYGFKHMAESVHEATGNKLFRLKFTAGK